MPPPLPPQPCRRSASTTSSIRSCGPWSMTARTSLRFTVPANLALRGALRPLESHRQLLGGAAVHLCHLAHLAHLLRPEGPCLALLRDLGAVGGERRRPDRLAQASRVGVRPGAELAHRRSR